MQSHCETFPNKLRPTDILQSSQVSTYPHTDSDLTLNRERSPWGMGNTLIRFQCCLKASVGLVGTVLSIWYLIAEAWLRKWIENRFNLWMLASNNMSQRAVQWNDLANMKECEAPWIIPRMPFHIHNLLQKMHPVIHLYGFSVTGISGNISLTFLLQHETAKSQHGETTTQRFEPDCMVYVNVGLIPRLCIP